MNKHINRRQFLASSMALASSTWLSGCAVSQSPYRPIIPNNATEVAKKASNYPPALLGLRGDHMGSQTFAHGVALRSQRYALTGKTEETYDLIVVGAGISGLAAAYRYWQKNPQARILILDNHDDFGGHAKRNELTVNGKTLITYGGSESLDNPKNSFSPNAHQFLRDLGVDYRKFHQYFQKNLYRKQWGLRDGIYFNQAAFGKNVIVPNLPNAKNAAAVIAQFPMSDTDKQALIALYANPKDYWRGKSAQQRETLANTTSYYDFLKNTVKLGDTPMKFLQNISADYWGHPINAVSVMEAFGNGYPALANLKLSTDAKPKEPYIYHFPDGNASIARLMVRKMIPAVASGNTMEDIVTAQFDYDQLDKSEHNIRIRLNSTALHIQNHANGTAVVYLTTNDTQLHQVQAKHTIFAGHSTIAAHIVSGMPNPQKVAMASSVKVPMIYAKIALKNARAWQKMGIATLYVPAAPYCLLQLDDPVNIGDYRHASSPDEPIVVHAVRIATSNTGKDAREMYRNGRRALMAQDYAALEKELFDQMREIYAIAGENFDDVVADVIINRWAHGYAYEQVGLFDDDETAEATTTKMRQPVGKIHFANTDVAWMPYLQDAIDEGCRATEEILRNAA